MPTMGALSEQQDDVIATKEIILTVCSLSGAVYGSAIFLASFLGPKAVSAVCLCIMIDLLVLLMRKWPKQDSIPKNNHDTKASRQQQKKLNRAEREATKAASGDMYWRHYLAKGIYVLGILISKIFINKPLWFGLNWVHPWMEVMVFVVITAALGATLLWSPVTRKGSKGREMREPIRNNILMVLSGLTLISFLLVDHSFMQIPYVLLMLACDGQLHADIDLMQAASGDPDWNEHLPTGMVFLGLIVCKVFMITPKLVQSYLKFDSIHPWTGVMVLVVSSAALVAIFLWRCGSKGSDTWEPIRNNILIFLTGNCTISFLMAQNTFLQLAYLLQLVACHLLFRAEINSKRFERAATEAASGDPDWTNHLIRGMVFLGLLTVKISIKDPGWLT